MKLTFTAILSFLVITINIQGFVSAQQKSLAAAMLVVDRCSPQNDSIISIGVLVNLKDDWHIYWRNPGDSGLPTDIEFKLPNGFIASEIKFPIPEVIASDEIINYGYRHQVLFTTDLRIPKNLELKEFYISAKITSLICKDICIAFDTIVTIKMDLSKDYLADLELSQLFKSTKNLLPQKNQNLKIRAFLKNDLVYLKMDDDENLSSHNIIFLSYDAGVFRNSATQSILQKGRFIEILLEPDPFRVKNPDFINGIIILENVDLSNNLKFAFDINLPVEN